MDNLSKQLSLVRSPSWLPYTTLSGISRLAPSKTKWKYWSIVWVNIYMTICRGVRRVHGLNDCWENGKNGSSWCTNDLQKNLFRQTYFRNNLRWPHVSEMDQKTITAQIQNWGGQQGFQTNYFTLFKLCQLLIFSQQAQKKWQCH